MLKFSTIRFLDGFGSQFIRSGYSNCFKVVYFADRKLSVGNKQFKPKLRSALDSKDADVFGKIGVDEECVMPLKAESLPDDDDGYDQLEINRDRRHILFYKYKLTLLIHNKHGKARIVEALKLFDEMKRDDRKKMRPFFYTLMISGAAENGYTEKAFELFEEALKHKLKPTDATFTSLFNSCAECPFKEMGLQKAEWLRRWLQEIGKPLHQTHYHAMIKAFGKLGDIKTVYELVDEMNQKEIAIDTSTFNHLLVAAISQPESGFGEAIKLYRRMRFHKVPRDLKTYNLLLRATKSCEIGDREKFKKLLHEWVNFEKILYHEKKLPPKRVNMKKSTTPRISFTSDKIYDYLPDGSVKQLETENYNMEITETVNRNELCVQDEQNKMMDIPNFLVSTKYNRMGDILNIDYDSLKDWKNRFILIGGMEGFLFLLESEKLKPNIKTFTAMLDLIPEDNQSEDNLIHLLHQSKVEADTGFYNIIIKRRCFRGDIVAAKKTFSDMQKNNIPVDLATFGVLASGCKNVKTANQLLKDLEAVGFRPNIQIMGAMMKKACLSKDIFTMELVMQKMTQFKIPADKRIIDVLSLTIEEIDKLLWMIEKGKVKPFGHFLNPKFESNFDKLKSYFEKWAAKTDIEISHPWDQFKYKREDWQYYKMRQYENTVKSKILERSDVQKAVKDGQKVNVMKLVYDV
ncbi:pentatricopeptide repeat-containing protein 1, mitochondrial-like [Tetranychus urticae]|uniref:Pentatricopeptide repeat-containing protein-mitochondrial domain-containing protein n=1 Tax=Tetranychus urticae TaxID=32264 RepID=T1KNB3_TETUR|nr:pentatricopeptide repeat-containing protein 1, mitochondrial-like [Tetranychus urticae]